jgi:hypothetical protein
MTNFEKKPVTTISPAITIVRLMRAARRASWACGDLLEFAPCELSI